MKTTGMTTSTLSMKAMIENIRIHVITRIEQIVDVQLRLGATDGLYACRRQTYVFVILGNAPSLMDALHLTALHLTVPVQLE
jgi:hypothetical protein